MAKRIKDTPVLEGADAIQFLEDISKPWSEGKKKMMKEIMEKDYALIF